jgi:hypothetical protein
MSIHSIARNGRLYLRTELLVAEIRLRAYARKAALFAVALGVALFGLGMLNVAAFLWLSEEWGPVRTALIIALVDFAVAAIAFAVAYTMQPGPELAVAEDMRKAALEATENEIALMQSSGVGGIVTGAMEMGAARLLMPTVGALVRGLKRKPATGEAAAAKPAARGKA